MTTVAILDIEGMTCNDCVQTVEKLLLAHQKILKAKASLEENKVHLEVEDDFDFTEAMEIIEEAGFDVVS